MNAQGTDWLARTANAKVHSTTQKIPALEWAIEKCHLKPLLNTYIMQQEEQSTAVRKDNIIQYNGSRYTVPKGTFRGPSTKVFIKQQDDTLIISDSGGDIIAKHPVSSLKGVLVCNNNHLRDHSHKIAELIRQASSLFSDIETASNYFEQIRVNKPRYIRDQIKLITKLAYEIQIDDMGFNVDTGLNFSPLHQTGAVYALSPSSSMASKPANQWNTFEIEATNTTIKVSLNGQPITNYLIPANNPRRAEGHIGLQCHTGNVQFQNILIRTLPD